MKILLKYEKRSITKLRAAKRTETCETESTKKSVSARRRHENIEFHSLSRLIIARTEENRAW